MLEPDERAALTNFVGFLLLPGVVSVMRGVKGGERPLDFLIAASREEHPGMSVINKPRRYEHGTHTPSPDRAGAIPPPNSWRKEWTAWSTKVGSLQRRSSSGRLRPR